MLVSGACVSRGDDLLLEVIEGASKSARTLAANQLLREFFRGYPVENLKLLLQSWNVDVLRAAVWIASELGIKSRPLLRDVAALLKHADPQVRIDAIDCALSSAGLGDGDVIAAVLSRLGDPIGVVRLKAADFVIRASEEQLGEAVTYFDRKGDTSSEVACGIRWLMSADARDQAAISARLANRSALTRKMGLAAAARIYESNDAPLRAAARVDDPDIREISTMVLDWTELDREMTERRRQRKSSEGC
jgi:hypothetical protein